MIDTLIGTKGKMGQTFVGETRVPYTVVKLGPCIVTRVKTKNKDGYFAVQLGFGKRKIKNTPKPLQGQLEKFKTDKFLPSLLKEIKLEGLPDKKEGEIIRVEDIFKEGDVVSVTGISKSKGFAGVVKRWHFAGGPKTHGQSDRHRAPGSIGQGTDPGRVWKGKKMAGHMGGQRVTIKNLRILKVNSADDEVLVSGLIPGSRGDIVFVKKLSSGSLKEIEKQEGRVEVVSEKADQKEEKNEEVQS